MKIVVTLLLFAFCLGCGYGSKKTTPPSPGVAPAISELLPDNINAGSPGFILTINGSKFAGDAKVNWNGTVQTTTVLGTGQVTINVTPGMVAAPAVVSVTVTNPGTPGGRYGGGTSPATSTSASFTVN
jgi:hypothetical protein